MASFTKGPAYGDPFGNNSYLRSTQDYKTESYTVSAAAVTAETIGGTSQKLLRKGECMAKITSGAEDGKIGPFQPGTQTNEVQTLTRTSTGGTVTLTFESQTTGTIPATAAGFTAAAVKTALEALPEVDAGDVTVTGAAGGPLVITFGGTDFSAENVGAITVDNTLATGGTITVAQTSAGSAGTSGATDGRADPSNIVGFNNTFLPWQLLERDVEIAVVYEASVVQSRCFERNAAGARIALTDPTAAQMRSAKGVSILFK